MSIMLQRIRRSFRRKKASYCVNCGHVSKDCYHKEYENVEFNHQANRASLHDDDDEESDAIRDDDDAVAPKTNDIQWLSRPHATVYTNEYVDVPTYAVPYTSQEEATSHVRSEGDQLQSTPGEKLNNHDPPALPPRPKPPLHNYQQQLPRIVSSLHDSTLSSQFVKSPGMVINKKPLMPPVENSDIPPPVPPPRSVAQPPPEIPNVKGTFFAAPLNRMADGHRLQARQPANLPHGSQNGHLRSASPLTLNNQRGSAGATPFCNSPVRRQQIQMAAHVFPPDGVSEPPPPPYPMGPNTNHLVSYPLTNPSRASPTFSCTSSDYRAMEFRAPPALPTYPQVFLTGLSTTLTPLSASSSPASSMMSTSSKSPTQAWSTRHAKTQSPVIMQSVKSYNVQRPVVQTASCMVTSQLFQSGLQSRLILPHSDPPPSYELSIRHKQQRPLSLYSNPVSAKMAEEVCQVPLQETSSPLRPDRKQPMLPPPPPPPPYPSTLVSRPPTFQQTIQPSDLHQQELLVKHPHRTSEMGSSSSPSESPHSDSTSSPVHYLAEKTDSGIGPESSVAVQPKEHLTSPKPERKQIGQESNRKSLIRNCPPEAFKFFMEQHIENVMKEYEQRRKRRLTLERELVQFGIKDPHCIEQMRFVLSQKETNYLRMRRAKLHRNDFKKIKTIGVGAFGEVSLVRSVVNGSKSGGLFAMKTLKKSDVIERKQVAHVLAEKDILAESENEWIVKLFYSFQDKDYLYFVMEYIPGGDLMTMLIKAGRFSEDLARFYIAELTCAVESVHAMGFIHRDIKPDNILIDAGGHIKLTDFGLCTGFRWTHSSEHYHIKNGNHYRQDSMDPVHLQDLESGSCSCPHMANGMKLLERRRNRQNQRCMAHSLVGTPNYIAPEVLMKRGYTQACDWWSVGVILYEMVVGQPPFLAENAINTQAKVIMWRETLNIPYGMITHEAESMIRCLCTDPSNRLGSCGGAAEVKQHPFLNGIDFSRSLRMQMAPWRPDIRHDTDTSNFDPIEPERLQHNCPSSDGDELERDSHGFYEFTFRRFFDDSGHPFRPVVGNRTSTLDTE